VEQGQLAEFHQFEVAEEMLESIRQLCARYPEPTIVVALDVATPFIALTALGDEQLERLIQRYHPTQAFSELTAVLRTLRALSSQSYCAPSVEFLPTVPLHRFLMRSALGSAGEVCAVVALLHFMREQQASWEEMNFFCINAGEEGSSVLVVVNGQIVNGIGLLQGSSQLAASSYLTSLEGEQGSADSEQERRALFQPALDEAFWEGLTQELAGLLAVHHLEDLVVLGVQSGKLVERLAETYQVYLFPHASTERQGYELALGAALLGDGLETPGSAAEVVERLQLRQAQRALFAPNL
jgi:predicted butyrate kinase (DUF1464 family)